MRIGWDRSYPQCLQDGTLLNKTVSLTLLHQPVNIDTYIKATPAELNHSAQENHIEFLFIDPSRPKMEELKV